MLVKDGAQRFLTHCRIERQLSEHTLRAYALDLLRFSEHVGTTTPLTDCDRPRLAGYLEQLIKSSLSPATVKRRIATIRALFRWLEQTALVPHNPTQHLSLTVRLPHRLPRALTRSEVRRLIEQATIDARYGADGSIPSSPPHIAPITTLVSIEILLATGIRVGELVQIRKQDIDRDTGTVQVKGKGNRERRVFLTDGRVRQLVADYRELTIRRFSNVPATLLLNSRGRPATTQYIRHLIRCVAHRAGLSRLVTPHMLRHSAATHLLDAGIDIRLVQRLLGHRSISTTELYTHVSDGSLRRALETTKLRARIMSGKDLPDG